jgi:hypothetical protein
MDMQFVALISLTVVLIAGVIAYTKVMYKALPAGKGVRTPDDKTYRLAFLVFIVVIVAYLGLGLGKQIPDNIIAILGTIAGYVLGGVAPSARTQEQKSDAEK